MNEGKLKMTDKAQKQPDLPRSFPRPGTGYYGYTQDPDYESKFFSSFMVINKIILPLYRWNILPLIGAHLWARLYVITTRGRKSGLLRHTPLEYFKIDDQLYGGVTNPRKSQWHKNILANPEEVWVQIGFQKFHAWIEFLEDEKFFETIKSYTRQFPRMAQAAWGWDPKLDDVETADFTPMLKIYRFFRIYKK